jgi:hypothetical protein
MHMMIWGGAALTLLGVFGLLGCIWIVLGIKRANLPDAEARAKMQRVVALNMAALGLSFIGLMAVIVGVILI